MPRLSLYRPEKGNDYKFIDRQISEMFQVGGTDVYLHKYLGPKNPSDAESTADQPQYDVVAETNIQDLLFLENRDRKYATDIFRIRGIYNVQDIDFNLSQFGLFIDNDTVFMTVHINDFVKHIGRKPISGDVIELPHLRDQYALNNYDTSLPRFFVISDVGRAAEGFSITWYPHLYRLKLTKLTADQQYADILNKPTDEDANFKGDYDATATYVPGDVIRYQGTLYTVVAETTGNVPPNTTYFTVYSGTTLQGILSTQAKNLEINDAILAQAEADAPQSGYETQHFYTLAVNPETGVAELETADETAIDASLLNLDASAVEQQPTRSGYTGYLLGDGVPENGANFGSGIAFPAGALTGDYFLRTDFLPNRIFRFDGVRWVKREDAVRHTLSNTNSRQTYKTSFINNTEISGLTTYATDVVRVTATGDASFSAGNHTTEFTIAGANAIITTDVDFNSQYRADIWLNESVKIPGVTVSDINGKLAVNINNYTLQNSSQLRYTIYDNAVEQRQSLSKAIKPKADL